MRFRTTIRSFLSTSLLLLLFATGTGLSAQDITSPGSAPIQQDGRQSSPVRGTVVWMHLNGCTELDQAGHRTGTVFNLLDKISESGKLKFDYVEAGSWKELEALVSGGAADIYVEDDRTGSIEGVTIMPGSFGAGSLMICSKHGDGRFSEDNFAAMNGKRLAIKDKPYARKYLETFEQEKGFSTEKLYFDSSEDVKDSLLSGKADLAVQSNYNDTRGLDILTKFGLSERRIAVSDRRKDLQEAMFLRMGEILLEDPAYMNRLTVKYIESPNMGQLAFSRKEMDLIRNAPAIDIYCRNDLPMYNVEKNGTFTGYFPAVLEQISEDTGLKFNIRGYGNTDKMGSDFKNSGSPYALCVMPEDYNFFMDKNLRATGAITSFTMLMLTKNGFKQDIKTVAYSKDSNLQDLLKGYGFSAKEFMSEDAALNAVMRGEADAILLENYAIQGIMNRRKYRNNLAVRFDPIINSNLVFAALSIADESLISIMNKELQNLPEEELWSYVRASSAMGYWKVPLMDTLIDNWYIMLLASLLGFAALAIIFMQHRFNQRLELSNKNKDVFLADMSHDFRTPLTAISGFAYLGKSESDPRYYAEIITSAAYMQELVNDILNIRQYSEGKAIELQPEPVIAETLYDSILSVMHGRAAAKNIKINFESSITYPYIAVDPMRVRQVFVNIIGNAVKYSPAGSSIEITVEDYMKSRTARVKAVITDHGEGMSRDFIRQRIFRPFEREKNAFSAKEGGSGLGLAITKIIMDRLGGTIAVESELGEGSTFTLDFPVETITKEQYEKDHTEETLPRGKEFDFSGTRVLLCEDNEVNTFIVSNILQKRGCEVDCAENGKAGLDKFEQSPARYYSVILMDIRMPVMDGIEAAKAIRALNRADAQQVPIIALSANAFEEDKMASAKAGMNAHLSKPVNVDALFRTMEQLLHTF